MRILSARIALPLAAAFISMASIQALQADPSVARSTSHPSFAPRSLTDAARPSDLMFEAPEAPFWSLSGKPEVKSSAVVVFDQYDGAELYSRNADRAMPIASITKLMTALVVREADLPLDDVITITGDDRDTERGTTSRLLIGTQLTRGDLLHLALMSSENRAAHALGRTYPGGMPAFVKAMNAKAKELGMDSAYFVEPTGLSAKNVASASDLVKLVLAASEDPLIAELSTSSSHTVTVGRQLLEFRNSNALVDKEDWHIALQKTGYTSDAGRCLVMATYVEDRPIVMVLLNSVGKYTRLADARRVRAWMESTNDSSRFASAHLTSSVLPAANRSSGAALNE
jgi:D-alanyl-D-alanine endopeptidase (penicillin-binding protein 7)